ncbi:related to dehydrogenases and related proteins [Ramularia collo-cygni]|uniref:Related to dehydrogenases and related proteins n=1 Tax=Ramularia collo-cygni TaxID=112498 RepID=A0A2D3V8C3_9PEZI|nr:related to dehydrogenases and related proteins [Ramularia collo-cygni]CZT25751.1 related to dehydrogenases and related proteins [Ramularia collo-cygni]
MSSQPIRVGLIGLNKSDCWAVNAHLPYLKDTSRYRIVALLNSSEDAARAAISSHGLSSDTRAYGSPEKFAEDNDIELVVCSVRVDRHYPILKPILEKTTAKAVHCEWPLGKNLAEAEELTKLAKSKGMKTILGLQGRKAPTGILVKELIQQGKIGKPLSITITAIGYNFGAADFEALSYLSDISIGGNMVTIHFSHILDTVTQAVGELSSYSVVLDTMRDKTMLRNKPFTYVQKSESDEPVKIVGEVPRTSHDQIAIQGHLENGAVFSFHMRGGHPYPNTAGLDWRVYGETGEIRVTAPSANLHFGGPGHSVQVHNHETNSVEEVNIPQDSWDEKKLPFTARAPARVYEAFADGKEHEYATWDDAVQRHRLVEELYDRSKNGSTEKKAEYTSRL